MPNDMDLGWLAGTLDGEGAIGIGKSVPGGQSTPVYKALVQMETTCEATAKKVLALFEDLGVKGSAYFYRGRRPEHRGSWNIRVARLRDVSVLSRAMEPISVTKRTQWALVQEFAESRLVGATVGEMGRVQRGGKSGGRPCYRERELAIYAELKEANRRGPR